MICVFSNAISISLRIYIIMYLPLEAHKSSTAALSFLGGVVPRPATAAVKNGSQILIGILSFVFGKIKKDSIHRFHIS